MELKLMGLVNTKLLWRNISVVFWDDGQETEQILLRGSVTTVVNIIIEKKTQEFVSLQYFSISFRNKN